MNLFGILYATFQLIVVLCFVYLIIFVRWASQMVDLLTNRFYDTYERIVGKTDRINDLDRDNRTSTLENLKRFTNNQRFQKRNGRIEDGKNRDERLYDIKENAPDVDVPKKRPTTGLSCDFCTITSRNLFIKSLIVWVPQVFAVFLFSSAKKRYIALGLIETAYIVV